MDLWVMFIGKNEGFLSGTCGHRTFGKMFFHLEFVNRIGSVLDIALHKIIHPFSWFWRRRLNRLVTNVTEFHGDSGR
jgi:hypothetical protein